MKQSLTIILPSCLLSKPGVSVTCNQSVSVSKSKEKKWMAEKSSRQDMTDLEILVIESNMTH